jgi:hypothetical protein
MPPGPTPEDIERWERERAEREAAEIAPAQRVKEQRNQNTDVIAEHDNLLADILFEITVNEIETGV